MKKLLSLALPLLLAHLLGQAQITSTDCLTELQAVYAHIDHQALLGGSQAVTMRFKHSYIMRLDPEGKTVVMQETKTYASQFLLHECEEFLDVSDATEAFSYRKAQYIIYRTQPTLSKASLIPDMDKGALAFAKVQRCDFIPAPGNDTLRHKLAFLTLSEDGQKRYKVKDMEIVWNPLNHLPVSITVNFTDKSNWKWARFDFEQIAADPGFATTSAKAMLLDEAGELRPRFKGSDLLDYR